MKIKKFKNLWTMGLVIFGAILIAIYLLKFIFPTFVVGVAEIPSIVAFGNYVDSHLWAYYLFTFATSFIIGYFYCCACCRKKYLSLRDICIVIFQILLMFMVQKFLPEYYLGLNITTMLLCPVVICAFDKNTDIKYMYSTIITFCIHSLAQVISLSIRDISTIISYPNSATYFILLIDMYIWQVVLYNYYNFKENK